MCRAEEAVKRSLLRNTAVNVAGQAVPAVAYAAVLPSLIHNLGLARFGVFALVWTLFSYLTLFDWGVARGTVRAIAQAQELGDRKMLSRITWTACFVLVAAGGAAGAVLWGVVPGAVVWLRLPAEVHGEAITTFRLTGAVLPVFLAAWGLQAVLEGLRWFGAIALARGLLGVLTALSLAAAARVGLPEMVTIMAGMRALHLLVLAWAVGKTVPQIWTSPQFDGRIARELVTFGRWVVVHAWMAPVLAYGDRFLVAALRGAADVSMYAVPQETVLRLMLVPAAVATAAYPVLSGRQAVGDMEDVRRTYAEGLRLVGTLLGPCAVLLALFPEEVLYYWIGPQAHAATAPLRLLAVGGLLLGCEYVPSVAFTALGRPDIPGRVTLVLAPVYLVAAALSISAYGATGAALAWAMRAGIQFGAYAVLLARILAPRASPRESPGWSPTVGWFSAAGMAALAGAFFGPPFWVRAGLVGAAAGLLLYRWVGRTALRYWQGRRVRCVGSVRSAS